MSKKYLILADSYSYVCDARKDDPDKKYLLTRNKDYATQYTLDEAIAIKATATNCDVDFIPINSPHESFEISINPIESGNLDFDSYAKWIMSQWVGSVNCFSDFLTAPKTQEKLNQAIANLKAYIEKEKQNKHYKFHRVTYVGFPLDLSDYTVQNFAPYFCLAVNYGDEHLSVTCFLIK